MSYGHYPPQNHYGGYGAPQPPAPPADPFRAWYADRLAELTFNSRPIIQTLSLEAMNQRDQNNWNGMQAIVEEVEAAILRVRLC
jgi:pre-mRNA cleavage complex 2 protein Pcf11